MRMLTRFIIVSKLRPSEDEQSPDNVRLWDAQQRDELIFSLLQKWSPPLLSFAVLLLNPRLRSLEPAKSDGKCRDSIQEKIGGFSRSDVTGEDL